MKIKPYSDFAHSSYTLMPFQFERLDGDCFLVVNDVGQYCHLNEQQLNSLINGELSTDNALFENLLSKSFVTVDNYSFSYRAFASKYRSRKSFINGGPGLHIFVLTLRCENSCEYCQVTRKKVQDVQYDMSKDVARQAVYRMFETPAKNITVEFQGGEPLLAFDMLRFIVELCEEINVTTNKDKKLQFVVATTLQQIDINMLSFMKDHKIHISTSLDGPEWLHNKNRPNSCRNSYAQTLKGIEMARSWLGDDSVAAMTTITNDSLGYAKQIIDEYVAGGFHSIFLRPLNMYGFAVKKEQKISYTSDEFNSFYVEALDYIIAINKGGYHLDEVNAALTLNNVLTPHPMGYVDMRSPCGEGIGVLVYNYNGKVYPSDESRMLHEMGDDSLILGDVSSSYQTLLSSKTMSEILNSGVAEALPGCAYCAYLPYCGTSPIQNLSMQGDMVGHRPSSIFCKRQKFLYRHLFGLLNEKSNLNIFGSWLTNHSKLEDGIDDRG